MAWRELSQLSSHLLSGVSIARRYAVVNGFDGALTMLGLLSGFRVSEEVPLNTVIAACLGAAVALGVSGITSAYLSEQAERRRSLAELEAAMVTDLGESVQARAARILPLLVGLINGLSPLLVSLLIITPLWLTELGLELPVDAVSAALLTAGACIFALGVFLGQVAGSSLLLGGCKALLVAGITMAIIQLL